MADDKKLADFMAAFLSTPEPEIDREYSEIEDRYTKRFGHAVPREMLPDSITPEQLKSAMEECIRQEKDCLFEVLGIQINYDYLY